MSLIYLNGDYVPHEQAKNLRPLIGDFLFADGNFTKWCLFYNRQPLCFDGHMQRLQNSLHEVGITPR